MNASVVLAADSAMGPLTTVLSALRRLTYPAFEVVLVIGPRTTWLADDLGPIAGLVKVVECPCWNAARAKNVGAAHAAGEIIAFLDPATVPDVLWLEELAAGYTSDYVAAVGGPVLHAADAADGEACYTADRRGNRLETVPPPYWAYQIPYSDRYIGLHVGNSSFRRSHFFNVGGFDEDIGEELYQTDLCRRLTDRGLLLHPSSRAIVYRVHDPCGPKARHGLTEAVRNKVLFAVRSRSPLSGQDDELRYCHQVYEDGLSLAQKNGNLGEVASLEDHLDRAVWEGIALAAQDRKPAAMVMLSSPFLPFPSLNRQESTLTDPFTRGLRVSIVIGVIVWRDAISNICLQQADALATHARRHRYPLSVKIYTGNTQETDARIAPHTDVASIAADPHFLESDVVIYHFGIYTPLFDTIHLAGPATRKIVCYYGITFPTLLQEDQREVMFQSYQQAVNLHVADRVLVTSSFLRCELARMGVADARIVQAPPAISFTIPATPPTPRPLGDEDLRLLYVGRFVRAKGVLDLVRAVAAFRQKPGQRVRLDLVGSKTFSDSQYIDQLQESVREAGLPDVVRFHFDAPTAQLVGLLGEAHVLVIPSYHEGFCVPVLEALACGCFVICSDAGALPETSNGLGRTFAMADADQLAGRLEEFIAARRRGGFQTDRGFLTVDEWVRQTRQYVTDLSPARCEERFCNAVLADLPAVDSDLRSMLAQRRRQLLLDLHGGPIPVPVEHGLELQVKAALAEANLRVAS